MYYIIYKSTCKDAYWEIKEYPNYSTAVSDLWKHEKVEDILTLLEKTNSKKLIPVETFKYSEEKKGYRPI